MYSRAYQRLIQLPPLLWVTAFLLVPYALLFCYSFWQVRSGEVVHEWNLGNFVELVRNPIYLKILMRSLGIAVGVTLCSLLLSFPLAYFLAFKIRRCKSLLYQLAILPLFISYLVRAYAWKTILGSEGVLNRMLEYFGIIHEPIGALLYSSFAVVLTLTHIYTPLVFLPIYASFAQIPKALLEASQDLGASSPRAFRTVVFPLSLPGVIAGATFAFVLSFGDFLAPLLIGGPNGSMISNLVVSLFGAAYDWPLGAAISLCMLILVVLLITGTERLQQRLHERGAAL